MHIFAEHKKKNHILSGVDARIKILSALALLGMVLTCRGLVFPVGTAVLCLIASMIMHVPLRVFIRRFSEPLFIAAVVLLLKLFFTGKEAFFSVHLFGVEIVGHRDGLMQGLLIAGRICGAVSVVALLGFSTPFTEFMAGLSWLRVPKAFIEILMFAYRYIFVLIDEAAVIYGAQKNRLGYSSIKRGLASFGVLAGSLTLKAFDHSQNTTLAMVQRGYDGTMPLLRHKAFRAGEIAISLLFVAGMGLLWNL